MRSAATLPRECSESVPARCSRCTRESPASFLAQGAAIAAAARDACAVLEQQPRITSVQRLDLLEAIEIHDVTAMHAHEARGIESLLDRSHRRAQWINAAAHVQIDVVLRR